MKQQPYQRYQHKHMSLPERAFPHRITQGIWMWSIYAEEKEIDFNGYLIETGPGQSFIVDPPCAGSVVLEAFKALPTPQYIVLTNADHERASQTFRTHFNIPAMAPEGDAPLLTQAPDHTYQDGHPFLGGWQAIQLTDQKTPGECALYNPQRRLIIFGDALIGKPLQRLSMLPADRYINKQDALQGLQKLRSLDVDMVLPGDGDPILEQGSSYIVEALLTCQRELSDVQTF